MDKPAPRRRGRPVSHGHKGSPTYVVWAGMKQAVHNPNATRYPYIGGKGLGYSPRWETFQGFLDDMGEKPDGGVLARHDRTKGFYPVNCFWAVKGDADGGE